jgi:VanZ family protein
MLFRKYLTGQRLAIGWSLVIFLLLCIPGDEMSKGFFLFPHIDKLVHFTLFAFFAFLWGAAKPFHLKQKEYSSTLIFLSGTIYGIALEFVQQLPFISRSFDYYDMIANSAGSCLIYIYRIKNYS